MFLGWSQADRDKAVWQYIRARQTCGGCGTRRDEWDPAKGGHPAAYIAHTERCEGCHQRHQEAKDLPPGMYVRLKRNQEVMTRAQKR